MSAEALLVYPGREEGAIVVGAWAVGWIISVVGARPGAASFTALLERTVHLAGNPVPGWLTTAVRWTPPLIMVASVPPAILTAASLWGEFAGNRAWSGVAMAAIALVYSTSARLAAHRQPSSRNPGDRRDRQLGDRRGRYRSRVMADDICCGLRHRCGGGVVR